MIKGPFIKSAAILVGGLSGAALGDKVPERLRAALTLTFGLCSIGLGVVLIGQVKHLQAMVLSVILGELTGELIYLESGISKLSDMARLYADGQNLKNPYLSPVYGDFSGFPPTILTTGTRDLFLSNTVRVHRALKRAGAVADLEVYDGVSHAQFLAGPAVPESREAFADIAAFFDRYLGR